MAAIVSITKRERMMRQKAYSEAVANLRLEGLEMDEESMRIFQRHVNGEITFDEFRGAIDNMNERKFSFTARFPSESDLL